MAISLNFSTLYGLSSGVNVDGTATIRDVKYKIKQKISHSYKTGENAKDFKIIYNDEILENDKTVDDYNIKTDSNIYVLAMSHHIYTKNENDTKIACYCYNCYHRINVDLNTINNEKTHQMIQCICCHSTFPYPSKSEKSSYTYSMNELLLTLNKLTTNKSSLLYNITNVIIHQIFNYSIFGALYPETSSFPAPENNTFFYYALSFNPYRSFNKREYEWLPIRIVSVNYKTKQIGITKSRNSPIIWISLFNENKLNDIQKVDWIYNDKEVYDFSREDKSLKTTISETFKYSKIYLDKICYFKTEQQYIESKDGMKIQIKTLTEKLIDIYCKSNDTTLDLKAWIWKKEGIPPYEYSLIHLGRDMEDYKTLQHYHVKKGSMVYLIFRLSPRKHIQYITKIWTN